MNQQIREDLSEQNASLAANDFLFGNSRDSQIVAYDSSVKALVKAFNTIINEQQQSAHKGMSSYSVFTNGSKIPPSPVSYTVFNNLTNAAQKYVAFCESRRVIPRSLTGKSARLDLYAAQYIPAIFYSANNFTQFALQNLNNNELVIETDAVVAAMQFRPRSLTSKLDSNIINHIKKSKVLHCLASYFETINQWILEGEEQQFALGITSLFELDQKLSSQNDVIRAYLGYVLSLEEYGEFNAGAYIGALLDKISEITTENNDVFFSRIQQIFEKESIFTSGQLKVTYIDWQSFYQDYGDSFNNSVESLPFEAIINYLNVIDTLFARGDEIDYVPTKELYKGLRIQKARVNKYVIQFGFEVKDKADQLGDIVFHHLGNTKRTLSFDVIVQAGTIALEPHTIEGVVPAEIYNSVIHQLFIALEFVIINSALVDTSGNSNPIEIPAGKQNTRISPNPALNNRWKKRAEDVEGLAPAESQEVKPRTNDINVPDSITEKDLELIRRFQANPSSVLLSKVKGVKGNIWYLKPRNGSQHRVYLELREGDNGKKSFYFKRSVTSKSEQRAMFNEGEI